MVCYQMSYNLVKMYGIITFLIDITMKGRLIFILSMSSINRVLVWTGEDLRDKERPF